MVDAMVFFELLHPIGIDFPQFYEAAYMWLHGLDPYQTLLTSPGPFNYPPSALLFLWWVGLLPFGIAGVVWNLASLGAYLLSLWLLWQMVVPSQKNRLAENLIFIIFTLFLTLPFFPVKFNLGNGQINTFILLFCVLSLWWRKYSDLVSAGWLALAIAIKITPLVLLLVLVMKKDWAQLVRVLLVVAVLGLLPLGIVPVASYWLYFTKILFEGFALHGKEVYYNQSLLAFWARLAPTAIVPACYYLSALALLITSWFFGRGRKSDHLGLTATAVALMLMLHALSWQHHLVFTVIPLIVLAARRPWWLVIPAYVLIAMDLRQPEWWLIHAPIIVPVVLSHQFLAVLWLWALSLGLGRAKAHGLVST